MMKKAFFITLGVSCAIALLIAWFRGLQPGAEPAVALAALSDGTFVVGILMLCMGVLVWVSTTGFFDMLSYGLQGLWFRLTAAFKDRRQQTFFDYKQSKEGRRRQSYRVPLLVGLILLAVATAALIGYEGI